MRENDGVGQFPFFLADKHIKHRNLGKDNFSQNSYPLISIETSMYRSGNTTLVLHRSRVSQ